MAEGRPQPGVMQVNQQTDLLARNCGARQRADDAQTLIVIDGAPQDLQFVENQVLVHRIRSCRTLQVMRGRGRAGRKLGDLLHRVR